jgi:DNA-binding transcriptional LysR family regulator
MKFNNMDLNLLRLFDAIFQMRSVTLAALSLNVTQPAASKQLNKLRELMHDPLFVRTHDGMAPTVRAEELAAPVRNALSVMRDAVERHGDFDPRTSQRTFRIFMTDVEQMVMFPEILATVAREAPCVGVETVQMPTAGIRATLLESGKVDLAIGLSQEFEGSMHCEVLFEEHYSGMVRAQHPEIHQRLTLGQLLRSRHLVHQHAAGYGAEETAVERAFNSAGIDRRVAVRLAHAIGLSTMVAQSDLLMIVPHRLAIACSRLTDVEILDLPIAIPRFYIAQYWHHRYHSESGCQWLRGIIARLFGSMSTIQHVRPHPTIRQPAIEVI